MSIKSVIVEAEPLTDDERDWLMTIYKKRKANYFYKGYFGTVFCIGLLYFIVIRLTMPFIFAITNGDNSDSAYFLTLLFSHIYIKLLIILLISVAYSALLYYGWMRPYKQDSLSGIKQMVLFTVIRKEYYPITGQYFISIKCHVDKRFEVNDRLYHECEEGGPIILGQAIKSGYIFCDNNSAIVN